MRARPARPVADSVDRRKPGCDELMRLLSGVVRGDSERSRDPRFDDQLRHRRRLLGSAEVSYP
jgi:hypothetical protein